MKNTTHQHAEQLYNQGISVFPALVDGSKKPQGKWKQYQRDRCSPTQLNQWFAESYPCAIAVVCGQVSNNLVVIDIDDPDLVEPFETKLEKEHPELYDVAVAVETGSGKRHLYLFCDRPFGPRQTFVKMASNKWAIEFRSEGNYVIGPGSPTQTHKSGQPYRVIRGDIGEIYHFTANEVVTLIQIAKSFERPSGPSAAEEFGSAANCSKARIDLSRPGDDFDAHTDWAEILTEMVESPISTHSGRRRRHPPLETSGRQIGMVVQNWSG